MSEKRWRDKDTLERLYWDEGLNQAEIAERLGCSRRTVAEWFSRHDLEARIGHPIRPWVYYTISRHGYPRWRDKCPPSKDDMVLVHRLLAVAEYGFDAVRDKHVHHKNGITWDNRPDNIELVTASEHMKIHHEDWDTKGEANSNAKLTQADVDEIRSRQGESTPEELAEEFGVSPSHIRNIWHGSVWSNSGVNGSA